MLTINDLSTSKELDRAAMTSVAGGNGIGIPTGVPSSLFVFSAPEFDLSSDLIVQNQLGILDQSNNWGGVNIGFINQEQGANA